MKPKDIIVGQKYTHKNYPRVVYLGIRTREARVNRPEEKQLAIIEDPVWGLTGDTVAFKGIDSFWDGFKEING